MTSTQFAAYIRLKTKTNSTTFTDVDMLILANIVKDDIIKEIKKAGEDYLGMETVRDLVSGKRNYGFPSYILGNIKYVQAKLDGTNWRALDEFDINDQISESRESKEKITTDETSILANWAGKKPSFDIFGGELVIYSDSAIIDVTGGLKLWSIIYPADLTVLNGTTDMSLPPSTTSFGMPRQLHKVWAKMVVIEWKNSQDRQVPLTENELNIQLELAQAISSLKDFNQDRVTAPQAPYNDGSQY